MAEINTWFNEYVNSYKMVYREKKENLELKEEQSPSRTICKQSLLLPHKKMLPKVKSFDLILLICNFIL